MPSTNVTVLNKNGQKEEEEGVEEVEDEDDYKNYQSPEQISYKLVTLSLLPDSRWKNLVNLDTIRVLFPFRLSFFISSLIFLFSKATK